MSKSKIGLLYNNKTIFTLIISILIIIIMDTSLTIFCTPRSTRIINISNIQLYFIYLMIFMLSNIILLKIVKSIIISNLKNNKYYYLIIVIVQSLLSITLLSIYGQMTLYSNYYNLLIFLIVYGSFLPAIGFLSILAVKLLRWFSLTPNYPILLYGIAISIFIFSTIIALIYITEALSTHKDIIKPSSCRAIFASLFNINPELSIFLSNLYDVTSILSFIVVWFATTIMLKQYSRNIGKIKYWILVSLPLAFFMTKYEIIFYYFLNNPAILDIFYVELNPYLNPLIKILLDSNIQVGGIFFAIAFLVIIKKLPKGHKIANSLIISIFGIMLLFGSKDISGVILPSFPPQGIVTISFLGLASYLLLVGIYSSAIIAARDINLRKYLSKKIENDTELLMNIALSEKESEIEKNVKFLMTYSSQWEQDNIPIEMNQQEVKNIIDDVISEIKKSKMKKDNTRE